MRRLTTAAALCLCAFAALAGNPTQVCEEAKEFGAITKQLPGYKLPSELDTQAHLISKDRLNGYALLKAARGSHVCIALVLDEAGTVQDVAAFYPKRIALSKSERNILLTTKYSPALVGNVPVKSITLIKLLTSQAAAREPIDPQSVLGQLEVLTPDLTAKMPSSRSLSRAFLRSKVDGVDTGVKVTYSPDGTVLAADLVSSTGNDDLDAEILTWTRDIRLKPSQSGGTRVLPLQLRR